MQRYGVLVRGGCLWDFPTIVLWLHEIRKWKMLSLFLLGWSCSPSHITCPFSTPPQATPLYPTYSHLTGKKLFLLKCPFFTARIMNIWIWSNACTLEIPKGIEDGGKGGGGDIVVLVNTSSPFSVHFTFSSKVISPYWFVRRRGTEIELPSTVISCGNSIVKEFDHAQGHCVGHISVVVKEAIL